MKRIGSAAYQISMQWLAHDNTPAAAALAFYTIFSLSPLVIIAVVIASWVFGPGPAEQAVTAWLEQQIGADAARVVKSVLASDAAHATQSALMPAPFDHGAATNEPAASGQSPASASASSRAPTPPPGPTTSPTSAPTGISASVSGILATILGVIVLFYGASLVFVQLHATLNRIMGTEVAADAHARAHLLAFVRGRLLSVAFTLIVGGLILGTVIANTVLEILGRQMEPVLGIQIDTARLFGPVVSFVLVGCAMYLLLRFLPHGRASWRETLPGALMAALLFELGKYLIALYLGRSGVASAYGAGGTIVAVLLWVYYSAHTFLLGAELMRYQLDRRAHRTP